MRHQKIKRVIGNALAAALGIPMLLAAGPASADKDIKIVLDWLIQGTHAPWIVAKEKGYFAAEGLNVQIDAGKGGTNTAINTASGVYQFGYVDMVTMINFNANNPSTPLQEVYIAFDETPLTVVVSKASGITSPKDLNGRKIGGGPGTAGHDTIGILLKAAHAEDVKIDWVNVAPNLLGPMMAKGEIVGIAGFTNSQIPAAMSVGFKREDLVSLHYAKYGVDLLGLGVVATRKYIEENPDVVKGLVKALNKGTVDTIKDPAAALAIMKKGDPMMKTDLESVRLEIALSHTNTDNVKKNGLSYVTPARVQSTIDAVVAAYGIKAPPKVEDVYTDKFLPPQPDRMVK